MDVSELYDHSLGTYDFDLVIMVAEKSQKVSSCMMFSALIANVSFSQLSIVAFITAVARSWSEYEIVLELLSLPTFPGYPFCATLANHIYIC